MVAFEKIVSGDDLVIKNKYGIFSRNELKAQLKEGHLTVMELGLIYGLKEYQIVHLLRCLDISYRNNLGDIRIIDGIIDDSLHQVLLGTLLGDAYMRGNFYLLGHGISQYDYCYHVAERLHKFVASIGDFNTKAKTKKSLNFWTYRHDVFKPYFNRFYSQGMHKKYIIEGTAYDIEPEGLAYWYMDDGKYDKYGAYLCVGDISKKEGGVLIDLLKKKFSISSNLHFYDAVNMNYALYIQAKSRLSFYGLITPYIIPSMSYKIEGIKFPRIPFIKKLIISRHLQLCKKAERYIRYFGDTFIQERVIKKAKFPDYKAEYIKEVKKRKTLSKRIKKDVSKKTLIEFFHNGLSDQQVADRYGFGRNKIAFFRRSFGIARKNVRITIEKQKQLKKLFLDSNMTIQKAMKELHLSFYKIKEYLKDN